MADAYRGLTIQIGGDTTKLSAALRAAKKAATETQAQLRLVSKAARFDPENVTLAANKLKLMGNVAEDLGAKLKNLDKGFESLEGKKVLSGTVKTVKQLASETENASLAAQQALDRYNKVDAMLERMNATLNKQAQATGKVSESFDIRGMGAEHAISELQSIGAITDEQITKFRHLKTAWRDAFNDKAAKDAVVTLQKMGNDAEATRAELKKLGVDMAALDAPSDIAKTLSSVDDQLAKADANAKYLASDLEKCEAALRLDPSNMDAARRKMTDLGAATDIANEKAGLLKKKLDAYKSAGIDAAASDMARLAEEADKANTEYAQSLTALKSMQGRLEQLRAEYTKLGDNPDETYDTFAKAAAEIQECVSKVDQLKAAEREAASASETANAKKEYAELAQEMQQAESQAKQLASSMERASSPSNWTHMKTLGMTLSAVLTPAMERFGSYAMQSATDIDTAYRNMRKTVQGSEGDFQKLKQSALEFSSVNFASADKILAIQAIGGELGVATESLDTFAQTASNLDIATDLDAEAAATALGQLDNILGDLNESTMPNFADSLVRLGNNGASTESQILDIATRIGSMASIVGMTTPDMLALSSTIASTGQNAEAAGTAISKTMSFMETAVAAGGSTLSEIAATANMSADQFAAAWEKRPLEAITAFIKGLNQLEENGGSADLRLQELGITAVRQKQAIEGLMQTVKSQNGELSVMDANAQMAADAWNGLSDQWGAAGDAAREAEAKNEGFAGSVQRLKNTAQNAASEIADSLAPAMDDIADAAADLYDDFSQASDGTKQFVAAAGVLAAGLGPGLSVIATMGTGLSDVYKKLKDGKKAFSQLTKGVDAARIVLGPMASQADVAALATEGLTLKMKAANVGAKALNVATSALKFTIAGLAIGAVAVLVGQLIELKQKSDLVDAAFKDVRDIVPQASGSIDGAKDSVDELASSYEDLLRDMKRSNEQFKTDMEQTAQTDRQLSNYIDTIEELGNKGNLTAGEQARLNEAVQGYKDITGDTSDIIDNQTGALQVNTEELRNNARAWSDKAKAEGYASYAASKYAEYADAQLKMDEATQAVAEAQERYNEALDAYNKAEGWDKNVTKRNDLLEAERNLEQAKQLLGDTEEQALQTKSAADEASISSAVLASNLSSELKDSIMAMGPEAMEYGFNIATSLQQGIESGAIGLPDALAFINTGVTSAFAALPPSMYEKGSEAMMSLVQAMNDKQLSASEASTLIMAAVNGTFDSLPEDLRGKATAALNSFVAELANTQSVTDATGKVKSDAVAGLNGIEGEFGKKGDDSSTSLAEALSAGGPLVNQSSATLMEACLEGVDPVAASMTQKGTEGGENFASGVGSAEGSTYSSAESLASATEAAKNNNGNASWWGEELGRNFAAGIKAAYQWVADAAASIAQAAADFLHHSKPKKGPLSEGEEIWGKHASQNFAKGLEKGKSEVAKAAEANAQEVADYLAHSQPKKGPLSQGEWIFGYHAAVNFADGLYSGVDEAANAAESVADAAEKEFQEYIDKMIAGYEKRGDEMIEVSTEMAEAIWGVFLPMANAEEYVKPFTGAVYDSMKVLESAGMTLDQYASKMEDMAEKKADWDKKMAASDLSDSTKESYADFMEEYNEFLALQSKLSASMEDMREWQGLYKMKDTLISSTTASEDLADALWDAGQSGATFSKEFLDYVADGGEDAVKALRQLTAMGPDALQEASDSFRDMAIAEKEAEVNAKSLYVNSLAHTNFKTQREQMLEFRDTVLDVREAMYSDDGLSNAFKMTGTSAEGFAADLMSVGMTMEDFKSQYADFTSAVSNGFSQMTKYNQTSLEDWERNLKLNMAEAQEWSKNLQEVFAKVPESIDSEAFRKAILEGGFDTWGKVIDEMAQQTPEQIAKYIELYNESMKEAQISGIEAFKALAPGEEMVQAIIDGMGEKQDDLNGAVTDASGNAVIEMLNTAPQWESAGATVAGALVPGIMSQANAIASAAAAVVSQAIAAAQAAASGAAAAGQAAAASYKASAQRAASPMMMAAQAAPNISTANTVNMTFTVNQQPGQSLDVRQLAKQVVKIQDREMRARGMR
jgi:TP901 family phage tail tape measure protein|nr:MAG TPA: minor tail protein [Caudoviricetes sp.]